MSIVVHACHKHHSVDNMAEGRRDDVADDNLAESEFLLLLPGVVHEGSDEEVHDCDGCSLAKIGAFGAEMFHKRAGRGQQMQHIRSLITRRSELN